MIKTLPTEIKYMIYDYLSFEDLVKISNKYAYKLYNPELHTFEWCIKNNKLYIMYWFIRNKKPLNKQLINYIGFDNNKSKQLFLKHYSDNDYLVSDLVTQTINNNNLDLANYLIDYGNLYIGYIFHARKSCLNLESIEWIHNNFLDCCTHNIIYYIINNYKEDKMLNDSLQYIVKNHIEKFRQYPLDMIKLPTNFKKSNTYKFFIKQGINFINDNNYIDFGGSITLNEDHNNYNNVYAEGTIIISGDLTVNGTLVVNGILNVN